MWGTPNYIAPEILMGKCGHSLDVDIWSIGVVVYTMLVGKPPYETTDINPISRIAQAILLTRTFFDCRSEYVYIEKIQVNEIFDYKIISLNSSNNSFCLFHAYTSPTSLNDLTTIRQQPVV